MGELCVVVPGIGGSVLTKGHSVIWDVSDRAFVRALLTFGRAFRKLSLPAPDFDDGVVADRLIKGAVVIPGFWNYGDYRPLSSMLARYFGPKNVIEFAYDWRRSCAISAARLRHNVDTALAQRESGTKVVLVAHSMGGLVARSFLAREGGAERCSLLVTVGTPYQGAAKAVGALAHGVPAVPGRTGKRLHLFLRSLPSVHELLPTYRCMVSEEGTRMNLRAQLPDAISSTGLFEAAVAFHAETAHRVSALGAEMPHTLAVAGQHQATATFVRWRFNGDVEVLKDAVWTLGNQQRQSRGDGTVPRGSAHPPEWGDDSTRAHIVTGRHVDLPSDGTMHQAVARALEGRELLGLRHEADHGLAIDMPDVVAAGEPLLVQAYHPDDRLVLDLSAFDAYDAKAQRYSAMRNLGDGRYQQTVSGLNPGTYHVVVAGIADGKPQRVSEFVTVLPDTR